MNKREELEQNGFCYNPDYLAKDEDETTKASAWYIKDDPHEWDEGIYVGYALDKHPELRRGFTLNVDQAIELANDLYEAIDGLCEARNAP